MCQIRLDFQVVLDQTEENALFKDIETFMSDKHSKHLHVFCFDDGVRGIK